MILTEHEKWMKMDTFSHAMEEETSVFHFVLFCVRLVLCLSIRSLGPESVIIYARIASTSKRNACDKEDIS